LAVTHNRVIADAPPRFARQHALGDTLRHSVPREVDRSIVDPEHFLKYNCDFYPPRRHPVQSSQFGHIGPLLSVDPRSSIMPEGNLPGLMKRKVRFGVDQFPRN
jgi:hypothetical protein